MRLHLDTVALIFAVESPERFTKRATAILQNTENILELSAISPSEIAIKAAPGKLDFLQRTRAAHLRTWTFAYRRSLRAMRSLFSICRSCTRTP